MNLTLPNNETYPDGKEANEEALMPGEISTVEPIIYESIDDQMVLKAVQMVEC